MSREFEIFTRPSVSAVALKRGFSWPGFFFTWIWAFTRRLWLQGAVLLAIGIVIGLIHWKFLSVDPLFSLLPGLIVMVITGVRGNLWRSRQLERDGYEFVGLVEAGSPGAALSAHALGKKYAASKKSVAISFMGPGWLQQLLAVASLTWKAALRFKLFLVIAVLLLAAVIGLPLLIKDDGTARGFTQILLTYTLSAITALLGFSTLWLSCGTLARDIEECQIQVVATKPIARWQIWLGKWLGIISLNAALLALSGLCVYGLLQWRATKLPAAEQATLHNQVLVARGVAKPDDVTAQIEDDAKKILEERLKSSPVTQADLPEVQKQIVEQVKAGYQLVPPGYTKMWEIKLGDKAKSLQDQPLQLRIKFNVAQKSASGTYYGMWRVGDPPKTKYWQTDPNEPMSLAADTYHEIDIPPGLIDDKGTLTIAFGNFNDTALLFPLDDGMEVLYRQGSFGLNFARGLGIIFCWMALLAAMGLASASFLSFPVAAFLSIALLTMALSSGTLSTVVSEGSIDSSTAGMANPVVHVLDVVIVPGFKVALKVIDLARDFSPIDSLSSGRSIPWSELGLAFAQIVLLLGGIFAAFGIFVFNRRELATAQNQS